MTVVLMGYDAQRRRQVATPWVFGALCAFVIAYPIYMHYRAKWGAPRRLALSFVSLAILVGGIAVHIARSTRSFEL
jgi:high-affinity Fe2+/Pb2+ permease